jgi:hypothetical protein
MIYYFTLPNATVDVSKGRALALNGLTATSYIQTTTQNIKSTFWMGQNYHAVTFLLTISRAIRWGGAGGILPWTLALKGSLK